MVEPAGINTPFDRNLPAVITIEARFRIRISGNVDQDFIGGAVPVYVNAAIRTG